VSARLVAAAGALIGAFGLGLQYWLLVTDMLAEGATPLEATWRYFAYFTILTNCFVTLVMARAALRPDSLVGLNAPRVELMAVTSIAFVGIVYNLLLASRWDPQGWLKLADVIVHDVIPVVFLLFWLLRSHRELRWGDAAFAALWPLAYAIYGLSRGAFDGFYPYFFMDPTAAPLSQIALNLLGLVTAFILGALLFIGISRMRMRVQPQI
jgi:hypothetical protein